ncbi:putative acyl-activating enzyme 16, chloroplastic [Panicum miliaceum]|uniref:4-coumarate--CoA ligase n=1 Tax=Panicum miliaceum TaxID=4540 RepID=A0A3L6S8F4_PANMI|nr:putative acyl-activating enzyme 16, chloroplastic [Panicum miliaceum]
MPPRPDEAHEAEAAPRDTAATETLSNLDLTRYRAGKATIEISRSTAEERSLACVTQQTHITLPESRLRCSLDSAGVFVGDARFFVRPDGRALLPAPLALSAPQPPPPPPPSAPRRAAPPPLRRHASRRPAPLEHPLRRKCSPLLESVLLPGGSDLNVHEWKAVPDIWRTAAEKYPDLVAVIDPYHEPPTEWTYTQLEQEILDFSQGLRAIGVAPDEKLALFADNSCRWLVADQGIMATGAINVVRGTRSSDEELFQIYTHSESIALVVDSPQFFNRLAESFISRINARFIVLLWGDKSCIDSKAVKDIPLYDYKDMTKLGRESRNALVLSGHQGHLAISRGQQEVFETITSEDVATLIYTSGTSGTPKGVMLTHRNLLHQIKNLWDIVPAEPGDRFLSMLPPWHAYERACEYFIFTYGIQQVYTNVKYLKEDLQRYQPHYIISVPLVYETLYSSIHSQISSSSAARKIIALSLIKISLLYMEAKKIYEGTILSNNPVQPSFIVYMGKWIWARFLATFLWPLHNLAKILVYKKIHSAIGISKAGISGGGSLSMHVDKFFEAIGIKVQNGYGLTETSPVVAARRPFCNVLGTVGPPVKHTEIKVFDIDTGGVLPDGSKGIVKIKGPQVMKGYYKNPSATDEALDQEGWFNTGDIGWIAPSHAIGPSRKCGGMLVLEGRAKDTIVLSTGENVEPSEIEEAASRSNLIHQIVVIGQDQRRLGAIVVPNNEEVLAEAKRKSLVDENGEVAKDKVMNMLYNELRTWTAHSSFRIGPIMIVDEPFTIDNGLMTPTMKIRRDKVTAKYQGEIEALFK